MKYKFFGVGALLLALQGCAMTADYPCGVGEGVSCASVSDVYQLSVSGRLPESRAHPLDEDGEEIRPSANDGIPKDNLGPVRADRIKRYPLVAEPGMPLRRAPRLLRIWIAPWEDRDGFFHEQSYVHMVVSEGEWLLRENRRHLETDLERSTFRAYQQ